MLFFHPVFQLATFGLSLYTLILGCQRFIIVHFRQKFRFARKRHAVLGMLTMAMWLVGAAGGMAMVRLHWHGNFITGRHWQVAFSMLPLMLFGFCTGLYMYKNPKKRIVLPLLHGLNNLVLIFMALSQFASGWWVYTNFIQQ